MLDPRRLLTFREVARRGSFSRAAEQLSLTQPAVSQQVLALERQLGIRLIDRRPGGLGLTAAGVLLLRHADAVAGRLRLASEQLGALAGEQRRHLAVGAFPSAIATIVPEALVRMRAAQPDLEVSVSEGTLEELAAVVRDGTLQLAVLFQDAAAPRRDHDDLERHDLFEEPLVAALPPKHRLARRSRIELEQLAGDAWTAPSRDGLVHRTCLAAGFEPNIAFITRDVLAFRELVASGLAVTLTGRLLAGRLEGIATPAVRGDPARRTIYAVRPSTDSHPLTDRLLAELTRSTFSSDLSTGRKGWRKRRLPADMANTR
jgi:DNA-binding transcriptional LysR family regulator